MNTDILKIVGEVAGIGGIAVGVLLIIFRELIRRKIFPQLTKDQSFRMLRMIVASTFAIALLGIGAWVWSGVQGGGEVAKVDCAGLANTGTIEAKNIMIESGDCEKGEQPEAARTSDTPPPKGNPESASAGAGVANTGEVKIEGDIQIKEQ
ncbi:MAG: hypothetical protein FJX66_15175 [Alphaproteobacteria bacterium]|nr:hypothetical protein [Alphaproteobacteria bacterium]